MAKLHLTDAAVKALSTEKSQEDVYDDVLDGFGVRVSGSTGRKSFFFRYRHHGRRRRITLGQYPDLSLADARREAKIARGQVAQGEDPAEVADDDGGDPITFGELANRYLKIKARPNQAEGTCRRKRRAVDRELGEWKDRPASEIGRRDILQVLDRITARGAPVQANRMLSVIRVILKFGYKREYLDENPAAALDRPNKEEGRDNYLTAGEICALWSALHDHPPISAGVFRFRLLTGQRGTEIRSMRWDQIEDSWWTIPADATKTGKSHAVFLSEQSRQILDALPSNPKTSPWVFRSNGGYIGPRSQALGIIRDDLDFYFQARDLRRTFATQARERLGSPRLHVAKVLNHKIPGITGVYDQSSYRDEMKTVLKGWSDELEEIVDDLIKVPQPVA